MKHIAPVFLFLLMLTAVPARASDLTLFGGVQNPSVFTLQSAGDTFTVDPRNFGMFGLRTSFGRVIGTEQTLAYSPNFIASNARAFIYNGNLIVHLPLGAVRPYGTVGLGTVYIDAQGTNNVLDVISGARFAVNYGGGIKFRLAGPLGGQIDVRGYTLPGVQDNSLKVLETSIGIVLSF